MASLGFSPLPGTLVTQAVNGTAGGGGIGAGNIPSGARYAEGYVRTASIVETRDGTAPTSTKGTEWDEGDIILLRSRYEIVNFIAIEKTSTDAAINWQFYNRAPN